jgi:signal transduction histidine kinase
VNKLSSETEVQKMLSIIYQIPMGLIETDMEGSVLQMNAKSVQLLMPQFFSHQLNGSNFHRLLEMMAPGFLEKVKCFTETSGTIINQQRQELIFEKGGGQKEMRHFVFTINKLDSNSLMFIFDDITELYLAEKHLNQILQDKAIEQSKFEMASGVLHDIGNAVVGFGSYVTRIKRSIEQNETGTLENLKGFIEKNQPALSQALGEKKANAVLDLLSGIISDQKNSLADIKKSISDQQKIISHVQEILNIQRQYVKGQSTEREPVNIRNVINDAVSILFGALDKKGIAFQFDAPAVLPKLKGDRTRLIQVFANLIKNAADAVTAMGNISKQILITAEADEKKLTINIQDNGKGFDTATAAELFTRGYTTKDEGTGLGLANCKSIIEGHNGEITLTSPGIGKGAVASVIFYL